MAFKRTYRKKPYKKCADKKDIQKVVNATLKKRVELKYWEAPPGAMVLAPGTWGSGSGAVFALSNVPVGTSDISRIGDRITGVKLSLRMVLTLGSGLAGSTVRFVVFRWKAQSNIDVLQTDKIMQPGYTGSFEPIAPYNHDNRSKFEVLSDRTKQLYGGSTGNQFVKMEIPLRNKSINFYAGDALNQLHGLYMIVLNDNTALASPGVDIRSRLTFTDM